MDKIQKILILALFGIICLSIGWYLGDNMIEAKKDKDGNDMLGGGYFAEALNQQEYNALLSIMNDTRQILEEEKKQTELLWCIVNGLSQRSGCPEEYVK